MTEGGTYAGHQLEDGLLGLLEQACDFVEALQHRCIVADGTGHASS